MLGRRQRESPRGEAEAGWSLDEEYWLDDQTVEETRRMQRRRILRANIEDIDDTCPKRFSDEFGHASSPSAERSPNGSRALTGRASADSVLEMHALSLTEKQSRFGVDS